jgi:hypothetical protein
MTTTLAMTSAPAVRPVPWRGLAWVAWRRYRPALAAAAALLGVVALDLLVRGHQMRNAYAAAQACSPQRSAACGFAFGTFHDTYGNVGLVGAIAVWVPGLLGAFAGAPLLARELETGTFRFTWTQGAGRMRWLLALLLSGVLGVAAISAAFGALITWYAQPLVDSGIRQRSEESIFPVSGAAVVGWGVAGFAIGVLAGLLVRRAVPALVTTLAAWTGLAFLASDLRKSHYQAPLTTSRLRLGLHDMVVQQWWSHGDVRVSNAQLNQALQASGVQGLDGNVAVKPGGGGGIDPVQYLLHHGYTQWTSYQPDSRYWAFQGTECAWLLLGSMLLLTATLWLVRRRGA